MIAQLLSGYGAATIFGAGTVATAVAVSLPQLMRIRQSSTVAGVSLAAVTNSALSFLAWTVYALGIGDGWLIASSAIGLPFAVATAVVVWRYGALREGMWVTWVWLLVLVATCVAEAAGWDLARIVVGVSIGWLVVPAVVTAWASHDVSGISAGSWWILACEGMLLMGYGMSHAGAAPVIYGVVALLGSGVILTRLALGSWTPAPVRHAVLAGPRF